MPRDGEIFVNVADMMSLCIKAVKRADSTQDQELSDAIVSVRSFLVLHLNKLHVHMPAELEHHYQTLLRRGG